MTKMKYMLSQIADTLFKKKKEKKKACSFSG